MLKIIFGVGKGPDMIAARGTTLDIVQELAQAIATIHSQFRRSSPMDAALFRKGIECIVSDANTPLWDADVQAYGVAVSAPNKKGGDENV